MSLLLTLLLPLGWLIWSVYRGWPVLLAAPMMALLAAFLSADPIFATLTQRFMPAVGGFVIAFSEVTITYAWKKVLGYVLPEGLEPDGLVQLLSTDYKFAVSFVILIIVLLFRPTGLFKGKSV